MDKRKVFAFAAVGALGFMIGSAGGSDATNPPAPAPTVTTTATATVTVTPPTVTVTERETVPVPGPTVTVRVTKSAAPKAASPSKPAYLVPQPAPEPEPEPRQVYYKNCDAARADGAAPVRRGDPGYGPHLDRDNDGVGCEG